MIPHPHLPDGEFDREGCAVASAADDLAADPDDLASASALVVIEIPVMLLLVGVGHQHLDIPPHDISGLVSKEALASVVEVNDVPVAVDGDDPVDDGLHQPGEGVRLRNGFGAIHGCLCRRSSTLYADPVRRTWTFPPFNAPFKRYEPGLYEKSNTPVRVISR